MYTYKYNNNLYMISLVGNTKYLKKYIGKK